MSRIDPFTLRRIGKFLTDFREKNGQLPTLRDFESAGFSVETIKTAVRDGALQELYVTLTNGTIVKGFKLGPGE